MSESDSSQIIIHGISGSPGICIGKAYLVDRDGVNVIKRYPITEKMVPKEIARFKDAVVKAKQEHASIIQSLNGDLGANLNILEAHMVLFKDKMLYGKTIDIIKDDQINAEWALRKVSRQVQLMFQQVDDYYLKSRVNDIIQVSDKIMSYLIGVEDIKISEINKRVILVAHDLSPADASQIQLERIKGFVTDRGGKDSHTGIIAKSLNIPSILGLGKATSLVKNDEILIVDGSSGVLIINPDEDTLFKYEERLARFVEYRADIERGSHLPSTTLDGISLSLLANIELVEEVVSVKDNKANGIGLFRTEFLYLDLKRFPTEEELLSKYKELVELMDNQEVTIRTLDINGDKVNPYLHAVEEANPVLGMRAVRFCLENQDVFITQIKAILRAAAFGNIKILIPMISCVNEIIQVKEIINQAVDLLKQEKKIFNKDIKLGIMIEVPSAVMMAEELAEHVDFFSIGTNDLIQYSMAIDRRNRQVAHLYQALDPAVLKLIKMTIDAAKKKKINVVMCGEMAGEPLNIPVLIGLGLKELSMHSAAIPVIRQMIRNLDSKETKKTVKEVLKFHNAELISEYIKEKYKEILPYIDLDSIKMNSQYVKVIATNKKARHDYHIDDEFEAGIVLVGTEVKAIREGRVSFKDAYAEIRNHEVFLRQLHISHYKFAYNANHETQRSRKLLLNKGEIKKLDVKVKERGYTIVPLKIYFKNSKIKVKIGLAKGKKLYDKRESIKQKDIKRDLDRLKKKYS